MQIPDNPTITKIEGVTPRSGFCGSVFSISPPIILDDGRKADFIITSFGLETIACDIFGAEDTFAVFPADQDGKVLDWGGIYSDGEGPEWCNALR